MDYIKVKGREHLVRDPKTNSIINTNRAAYEQYVRNRDVKMEEKQKLQTLEEDVANMKDDLNEICLYKFKAHLISSKCFTA